MPVCKGVKSRGGKCQKQTKNESGYCSHHWDQDPKVLQTPEPPRHFSSHIFSSQFSPYPQVFPPHQPSFSPPVFSPHPSPLSFSPHPPPLFSPPVFSPHPPFSPHLPFSPHPIPTLASPVTAFKVEEDEKEEHLQRKRSRVVEKMDVKKEDPPTSVYLEIIEKEKSLSPSICLEIISPETKEAAGETKEAEEIGKIELEIREIRETKQGQIKELLNRRRSLGSLDIPKLLNRRKTLGSLDSLDLPEDVRLLTIRQQLFPIKKRIEEIMGKMQERGSGIKYCDELEKLMKQQTNLSKLENRIIKEKYFTDPSFS